MIKKLSLSVLCLLLMSCASSAKKKTTPTRKDVNAEDNDEKKEKKQSYAEAWQLICHAEVRAGATATTDRQERAALVADWITANVTNRKARYWWIAFGSLKKNERAGFFRRDAKAAGVDPCPLADFLFAQSPTSAPASAPTSPGARRGGTE